MGGGGGGGRLPAHPYCTELECRAGQVTWLAESLAVVLWAPAAAVDVDVGGAVAKRAPLQRVGRLAVQHPNS